MRIVWWIILALAIANLILGRVQSHPAGSPGQPAGVKGILYHLVFALLPLDFLIGDDRARADSATVHNVVIAAMLAAALLFSLNTARKARTPR
jgi:hypothetical protein